MSLDGEFDDEAKRASARFRAEPSALYVVATPIGNLRDVTLRALDVLRSVDVVRAEDTRVTSVLLAHYGIATRPASLHEHNEAREIERVLGDLAAGRSVALVTDAGTPAIRDPGARLVRAVAAAGFRVVPIPGANAAVAAVCAAGLASERFVFLGFLPTQPKARRALFETFAPLPAALVIYEAPHRIGETLRELASALDPLRTVTIARELTKRFETIATLPLADASAWLAEDVNRTKGEFVLVVDKVESGSATAVPYDARRVVAALVGELPPARAARVAAKITNVSRDELYAYATELAKRRDDA